MATPYKRFFGPPPIYNRVCEYKRPRRHKYSRPISVAGPCSVESHEQIEIIAKELSKCGIMYLRGGIFRAGTYPGDKFGFVDEYLIAEFSRAAHDYGMDCVMEVLDYRPKALEMYARYADALQVGARQMQNYTLLRLLGSTKMPIFLKRNVGATLDEFLGAAEHLLAGGSCYPVLVERGSSSYHNHVRWDLSISIIPAIKKITEMPIIVDASHGTGRVDLVEPMIMAGIAAGADGFLIETHPTPEKSLSDSEQAYPLDKFKNLNRKICRLKDFLQ